MSCRNTSPVIRNYIGLTSWDLRHRTGYSSGCGYGVHGGQHNEEFNSTFHTQCGSWINYLHVYTPNGFLVDWVGDIGVTVCKSGYHGEGRAFDLSQVRFTSGNFFDMNVEWREGHPCVSTRWIQAYIGTVASLRRYFFTVLTGWYNSAHHNHIHFDNGTPALPIRTNTRTDATLIQAICRYMSGENIVIDGVWGPATEGAYQRLLLKMRMQCTNPKGNLADALLFFHLIAKGGFAGYVAGYPNTGPC